jgi:hypothetical protein
LWYCLPGRPVRDPATTAGILLMKKFWIAVVVVAALVIGVIWGELAHRSRFFPHPQLRALGIRFGFVEEKARVNWKSRSRFERESLTTLGYIDAAYDPRHRERGVLHIDADRVFEGVRFYNGLRAENAILVSAQGEVLHEWARPLGGKWQFARLLPDGDIIVRNPGGLTRLAPDSEIVWKVRARTHHDFCIFDDRIYALTDEAVLMPSIHEIHRTADNFVSRFTLGGDFIDRISLIEVIRGSQCAMLLPSIGHLEFRSSGHAADAKLDIIHSNHVEVMDGSLGHLGDLYRRGNILVTVRQLNLIMVFDPATRDVLWAWGPSNLVYPHHAVPLDNGRILVFSNGTEQSEIIEVDPLTNAVEWRYTAEGFFSERRGAAHRLPNGNTLITESDRGRAIEVTSDGDVVWHFANPDVDEDGRRGVIYCMAAFPSDSSPFIADLTGSATVPASDAPPDSQRKDTTGSPETP